MSATTADAKRLTIAAVGVSALFAAVGDLGNARLPRLRIGIGAVILGSALALGAEFAPELVAPFAALILVGALISTAPSVVNRISGALNPSADKASPPKSGFDSGAGAGGGSQPGQSAGGGGGGSSW